MQSQSENPQLSIEKKYYMQRALHLARRGVGRVSPNPMVGAVVAKNGFILGEGYHHCCGEAHAEVLALATAGDKAQEADLYVNLEPCCCHGKTPPCTDQIIKSKIKTVFAAMPDPNPKVSGKGFHNLKQAGIKTECGLLDQEAVNLNEIYIKYISTGIPFITLKAALTLDGKIATSTGKSHWISNSISRKYAHFMRAAYDAVLVGIETLLVDDCLLTARLSDLDVAQPKRIILDAQLRIPENAKLLTESKENIIISSTTEAPKEKRKKLEAMGIKIISTKPDQNKRVNLVELLSILKNIPITSILVEGGSEVYTSFLEQKLVDKCILFYAPQFLGGIKAKNLIGGLGYNEVQEALKLEHISTRRFGSDWVIEGKLSSQTRV